MERKISRYVLIDSSVIIALYNTEDTQHVKAKEVFMNIIRNNRSFHLHACVISESLNVIKYKTDIETLKVCSFDLFDDAIFHLIRADTSLSSTAIKKAVLFMQKENRLSFVDAMLIQYALKNDLDLVTFDEEMQRIYNKLLGS